MTRAVDVAGTSPPIIRASSRVMARPRPVPPKRCAVEASARVNSTNSLACYSAVMPMPVLGENHHSLLAEKRRMPASHPIGRHVIGMGQLEARQLGMIGGDNLDADRQTLITKASRSRKRRTPRHGDEHHAFHPFMIRFHSPTCDLVRPVRVHVERKQLCRRSDEVIVSFKESPHGLIPLCARERCGSYFKGREFEPALDFEYGFRLQQSPFCRILIIGEKRAAVLPSAKPEPSSPYRINRKVRQRFLDDATELLECLKRALADVKHVRLIGNIAVEIADPSDALAPEVGIERARKYRSFVGER